MRNGWCRLCDICGWVAWVLGGCEGEINIVVGGPVALFRKDSPDLHRPISSCSLSRQLCNSYPVQAGSRHNHAILRHFQRSCPARGSGCRPRRRYQLHHQRQDLPGVGFLVWRTSRLLIWSRYQGFSPANSKNVIQRQWSTYDPVTSATDPKLRCNGGTSATENATVAAGGKIAAVWGQWTHSQGPILVWMYKCPGAFSSCTGDGAKWFKIDEAGFSGDGVKVFLDTERPSGWEIAKLVGGNKQHESTIPPGLAPGNYLIRHELIALHQANAPQFYPECAQIVVTGSGTAEPDASHMAAIPGYCKQTDSNIRVSFASGPPGGAPADDDRSPSTTTLCPRPTRSPARPSSRAPAAPRPGRSARRA